MVITDPQEIFNIVKLTCQGRFQHLNVTDTDDRKRIFETKDHDMYVTFSYIYEYDTMELIPLWAGLGFQPYFVLKLFVYIYMY